MVKKAIFISLFFITSYFWGEEIQKGKCFLAFDGFNNEVRIFKVRFNNLLGFKYGEVYFFTDKATYKQTLKNQKVNYKWFVYTSKGKEILRVNNRVWVMTIYDYETDRLDLIITSDHDLNMFNHLRLNFRRKDIK